MGLTPAQERSACTCCGAGPLVQLFQLRVLSKYTATYATCSACGSLCVTNPTWLEEAYRTANRDRDDAGRTGRATTTAEVIAAMQSVGCLPPGHLRWLDYGAGDGVLVRKMTSQGHVVTGYDPWEPAFSRQPSGMFDGCSLIEVLEHSLDATALIASCGRYADTIVLMTELYRGQGPKWAYLATAFGQHITFPTLTGLRAASMAAGFEVTELVVRGGGLFMYLLRRAGLPVEQLEQLGAMVAAA